MELRTTTHIPAPKSCMAPVGLDMAFPGQAGTHGAAQSIHGPSPESTPVGGNTSVVKQAARNPSHGPYSGEIKRPNKLRHPKPASNANVRKSTGQAASDATIHLRCGSGSGSTWSSIRDTKASKGWSSSDRWCGFAARSATMTCSTRWGHHCREPRRTDSLPIGDHRLVHWRHPRY